MSLNLKNHPFAVEAFFKYSIVLTFAVPKEQLYSLLPTPLRAETYNDQWGFIAVSMVDTQHLRPKGFPAFMGNSFFLIGYRIFVQYTNQKGKRLRGLYILKSQTNKKKMELLGNIFTHYNYSTTDIIQIQQEKFIRISSNQSDIKLSIQEPETTISLPASSPFPDWNIDRRYAGPLPFTFTKISDKQILIIEGVRSKWIPQPVEVREYSFGFLDQLPFSNYHLANAFIIRNIPYHWKKGVIEHVKSL
ncbi:DUF2071 domain-containing protein [Gynurincola endophyticus]|uniref:DUF2071 domain-containing protein n=1 Tax=Gynurincola endophyticus TaxID=2479004 RepID=UPI000F8D6BEC|nr:DUF2071 domain-containing protein [Gynurincola endophyticus]